MISCLYYWLLQFCINDCFNTQTVWFMLFDVDGNKNFYALKFVYEMLQTEVQ